MIRTLPPSPPRQIQGTLSNQEQMGMFSNQMGGLQVGSCLLPISWRPHLLLLASTQCSWSYPPYSPPLPHKLFHSLPPHPPSHLPHPVTPPRTSSMPWLERSPTSRRQAEAEVAPEPSSPLPPLTLQRLQWAQCWLSEWRRCLSLSPTWSRSSSPSRVSGWTGGGQGRV